jgi:OOP family OmpA-OmpF porin
MYSVSLVFPFGRTAAPMPRVAYVAPAPAPMPEPVVVMAAPLPPVVVVVQAPQAPAPAPMPPAVRRVSYSAESLFGFDKSTVRPEGMTALDGFAAELAGAQFDSVTVEGHTDRLGSTTYNQSLSEQRAEAVKNYLVTQGKVDPAKIKAVGMSESNPVTKPEDCKGNTQSKPGRKIHFISPRVA